MFCVYTERWEQEYVMDENGQKQFDVAYDSIGDFHEGLACVSDEKNGQKVEGYVDAKGTLQFLCNLPMADTFLKNGQWFAIWKQGNAV
ncbi:MAG: hypothetical protein V8Q36_11680 [Anaerotignum sp.]